MHGNTKFMTTLIKHFLFITLLITLSGCDKATEQAVQTILKPTEKITAASPEQSDFQVHHCNLTYKGQLNWFH